MLNFTQSLSDVSRTNQIKIEDSPDEVAECFYRYLHDKSKGIEHFILDSSWRSDKDDGGANQYRTRDQYIKEQVKQRLASYKDGQETAEPQYFVAYSNGQTHVYFLSPNKENSTWKSLYCGNEPGHRQRILNLLFKFHILSQSMSSDAISGFEEVILPHTKELGKKNDTLYVWGLMVKINFSRHQVLTMHLQKRFQTFSPKENFRILDGEALGEIQIYNKKKYYLNSKHDSRKKNKIVFMHFGKDEEKFKKTQLYYYQRLMSELEKFLKECQINFSRLDFQANCYLDHAFITDEHLGKAESLNSLVIINNTGSDLRNNDRLFLKNFFQYQGVSDITFYKQGKTISEYHPVEMDDETEACWQIKEVLPWDEIKPEQAHNYLVFNRELDEDSRSMAYQGNDGFWYCSTDTRDDLRMDFYSQFKRRFSYLAAGVFYSMQGINVKSFITVVDDKKKNTNGDTAILTYPEEKINLDDLRQDCGAYAHGQYLSIDDNIVLYVANQANKQSLVKFLDKHKIKISPEFQRVLIEISIKSWIRAALADPGIGLPINNMAFQEKHFYTIFVRSPKNGNVQAVAVDFLYKSGYIYINGVIRDLDTIEKKFPFLRRRKYKSEEILVNDQELYVDESCQSRISCYTNDFFTPTLIGRHGILEEIAMGTLEIGRKTRGENSSRLLPLVTYYSGEIIPMNRIRDMICFDTKNKEFIQYYVPPKSGLNQSVKNGFRVYHLIGYQYSEPMTTQELIEHPLVALHFNTLTQNILKISENSQSSLLQKVAKVLVEN